MSGTDTMRETMTDAGSAEGKLAGLRELVVSARSMPMSASCVINRGEVLAAIDDVIAHLPDEIAEAQEVIDDSGARLAEAETEAERILASARERAAELAAEHEVVKVAEQRAASILADARTEATELRREADAFVDARMAAFESVLQKTMTQVRTARARLAERSGLDADAAAAGPTSTA